MIRKKHRILLGKAETVFFLRNNYNNNYINHTKTACRYALYVVYYRKRQCHTWMPPTEKGIGNI